MRPTMASVLALAALASACAGPVPEAPPQASTQESVEAPSASIAVTESAPTEAGQSPCSGDAPADEVARARALIDAADISDSATIDALENVRFSAAGTLAACQALQKGVLGDSLWAATWLYVSYGTDPAPLVAVVANNDPTIKVLAAAGLASLGRVDGLNALVESIGVDAGLRGSLPPVTVSEFALVTLTRYTGLDQVKTEWTSWLQENRDHLSYDAEQQLWVVVK